MPWPEDSSAWKLRMAVVRLRGAADRRCSADVFLISVVHVRLSGCWEWEGSRWWELGSKHRVLPVPLR